MSIGGDHTHSSKEQPSGRAILYPPFNNLYSLAGSIPGYGEPPDRRFISQTKNYFMQENCERYFSMNLGTGTFQEDIKSRCPEAGKSFT